MALVFLPASGRMKGSNSKQNKSLNLRLVLSEIVTQGPLSRADLARATALTKQTITNLVDELLRHQLVVETGQLKVGVGKPSTMLMLNGAALYSVALRIWPERLEFALSDLTGHFIGQLTRPRHLQSELTQQLATGCEQLLAQYAVSRSALLGAGVTMVQQHQADPLQRHQELALLQQQLTGALALPVCASHTATACAAYQLLHGEARSLQSFCYLHIGQQIDCALVYQRQLLQGQHGLTGALGEIFVTPDQDHSNGDFGRLNDFASVRSLQQYLDKRVPGIQLSSAEAFTQLAPQADKLAPWFERATEPLRVAIHTLESLFNCQTIIIGGEVSTWFLDRLISKLRPLIPSIAQYGNRDVPRLIKTPQVERVALQGLATLPLHCAIRPSDAGQLELPPLSQLDARQLLLFGPERACDDTAE
jgi:predicted NBD/HSP70 family sugar kinase